MPINSSDAKAIQQYLANLASSLNSPTTSTGQNSAQMQAWDIANAKQIVDMNQDAFSPSDFAAINNDFTNLNSDILNNNGGAQFTQDYENMYQLLSASFSSPSANAASPSSPSANAASPSSPSANAASPSSPSANAASASSGSAGSPSSDSSSVTLSTFSSALAGTPLAGTYQKGVGNQKLADMVGNAVNAGDRTSFNTVSSEIMKSVTGDDALTQSTISTQLAGLANNTHWKADGGKDVIAKAIGDQAGAMIAGDWNNADASKDVQNFVNDFTNGSSASWLQQDANQVLSDSKKGTDQQTALDDLMSQAIAYAKGGYKPGVDPNSVTITSAGSQNKAQNTQNTDSTPFSRNDSDYSGQVQDKVPADGSSNKFSFSQADITKAVTAQPPDYKALAGYLMDWGTQVGPTGWDTSGSPDKLHALVDALNNNADATTLAEKFQAFKDNAINLNSENGPSVLAPFNALMDGVSRAIQNGGNKK